MSPGTRDDLSGSAEPMTPMWLPALGAALFIAAGLAWAVAPAEPPPSAPLGVASAAPAGSAAPH